jgi:hypothetical protein
MNREEDLLQQIVSIASVGRDFFVEMKSRVADSEVRAAFDYISDVRWVITFRQQLARKESTSTSSARSTVRGRS